jgi:hypothetical protein
VFSETVNICILWERRLHTEVLWFEYEREASGVEQRFVVRLAGYGKAERCTRILELDVRSTTSFPWSGSREHAFWYFIPWTRGINNLHMNAVIYLNHVSSECTSKGGNCSPVSYETLRVSFFKSGP